MGHKVNKTALESVFNRLVVEARCKFHQKKFEEALHLFKQCQAVCEKMSAGREAAAEFGANAHNIASCLHCLGEFDEAKVHYEKALAAFQRYPASRFWRALMGDIGEKRVHCASALASRSNLWDTRLSIPAPPSLPCMLVAVRARLACPCSPGGAIIGSAHCAHLAVVRERLVDLEFGRKPDLDTYLDGYGQKRQVTEDLAQAPSKYDRYGYPSHDAFGRPLHGNGAIDGTIGFGGHVPNYRSPGFRDPYPRDPLSGSVGGLGGPRGPAYGPRYGVSHGPAAHGMHGQYGARGIGA